MRLNVNKLLHTPDARQDFRFEMDLSVLEFGGSYPVSRPVVVDCRLENKAGLLLCGPVQASLPRLKAALYDRQHTGPAQTVCLLALGFASLVLLVSGTYNPFIYFRF